MPKLCKYVFHNLQERIPFPKLVMEVLKKLEGAYALLIKSSHYPGAGSDGVQHCAAVGSSVQWCALVGGNVQQWAPVRACSYTSVTVVTCKGSLCSVGASSACWHWRALVCLPLRIVISSSMAPTACCQGTRSPPTPPRLPLPAGELVAAKRGSPMILGIKDSSRQMRTSFSRLRDADDSRWRSSAMECWLASDTSAILEYTKK